MSRLPDSNPESLLVHGPGLRALARELVGDAHLAEDLVQETWLRALQHPPPEERPLRRWLAAVLRNLAFQGQRSDASRAGREAATARTEATESAADTHERFALHRTLVETIDEIGEPYRETILLRYFDGVPPRAIAARLGIPTKTVKTRLNRGLALLRARLERRYGDRGAWIAALLPLLRTEPPAWPATISTAVGITLVKTALKLGVAAIALLGLSVAVLQWGAAPTLQSDAPTHPAKQPALNEATPVAAASDEALRVAVEPPHEEPASVELAPEQAAERSTSTAAGTLVRGLLLDHTGAAAGGETIWLVREALAGTPSSGSAYFVPWDDKQVVQQTRTDVDGRFELPGVPAGAWWIGPAAERRLGGVSAEERLSPLATVLRIEAGEVEREIVLRVTRGEIIQGVVLDPNGAPVPRINVSARSIDSRSGLFQTDTDEQGAFTLGPLSSGSFSLRAFNVALISAEEVTAQAGDVGVVVRCTPPVTLRFQALERPGQPCSAKFGLFGPRPLEHFRTGQAFSDQPFQFEYLPPGTYDVTAVTEDGRFGVLRGFDARSGSETGITTIPVEPGAALKFSYEGPESSCSFRVFDAETCVVVDSVSKGAPMVRTVPVGRLRVVARSMGAVRELWVETVPGREHEVPLRFEQK